MAKYYLTAEYKSMYLKLSHPDPHGPRIKREADVQSLIDLMENTWFNPMSPDENDIFSLSTGYKTPLDVIRDLLKAHEKKPTMHSSKQD